MTEPLRIVFAGTPEFAAEHLKALLDSPYEIVAVYTQPDRPAGRGQKLMPSPVKQLALEHNIPVMQPPTLRAPEAQAELAALVQDAELSALVPSTDFATSAYRLSLLGLLGDPAAHARDGALAELARLPLRLELSGALEPALP